jgi:hypothetical protein
MNEDERNQEALFRHAILGELLSRDLRRGELRPMLEKLAEGTYQDASGRPRLAAYKTLEEWFYKYRNGGLRGTQATAAFRPRFEPEYGRGPAVSRIAPINLRNWRNWRLPLSISCRKASVRYRSR